jgi:hypothetical protein
MNNELMHKTAELVGATSSNDLLYKDYECISSESSSKDLNMHRVRGSIRLTMGKVVMPADVAQMRNRVSKLSLM